jgi:hemolysin III
LGVSAGSIGAVVLIAAALKQDDSLLVPGVIVCSIGAAFHHWERLPFRNVIWHGLVLAAAVCHYSAILGGVVLRGGSV